MNLKELSYLPFFKGRTQGGIIFLANPPLGKKGGINLPTDIQSIGLCLFYPQAGRALPFCLKTKRKQKVQGLISNKVFHWSKPKTHRWCANPFAFHYPSLPFTTGARILSRSIIPHYLSPLVRESFRVPLSLTTFPPALWFLYLAQKTRFTIYTGTFCYKSSFHTFSSS